MPVTNRALQHVVPEAIDLQEEEAGHVRRLCSALRRALRLTTLRVHTLSSSIESSEVTSVVMSVRPRATMIAVPSPSIRRPTSIDDARRITSPLSTSEPNPSVSTATGSAKRITSGHTNPFTRPITPATTTATPKSVTLTPGRISLSRNSATASSNQTSTIRRTKCGKPLSAFTRPSEPRAACGARAAAGRAGWWYRPRTASTR